MESPSLAAISEAVDARSDYICETLQGAVRISSEVPPGDNYREIVDFFRPEFQRLGFETRIESIPNEVVEAKIKQHRRGVDGERVNLVAFKEIPSRHPAGFYCHLDTVPVGDRRTWGCDPLSPFIRDGYVWGRGTADSKAGATAILWAFRILDELRIEPQVSPLVTLTTDEEIGPYSGLMYLADTGTFANCKWFYSADGLASSIGIGSPGSVFWRIKVKGRSVHSGSSFLGVNPIEHAVPLMDALLESRASIASRISRLTLSPEVAAESGRSRIAALLNMTSVNTAEVQTLVPPDLTLTGDRLYIPDESLLDVTKELEAVVDRARTADALLDCSLETDPFYEPFEQDPSQPWLQRVKSLSAEVHKQPMQLAALGGPTDVAYVANKVRIPVVIHGVIRYRDSRNHAPDERCRIEDLLNLTKVIAGLAAGYEQQH